MNQRKLRAAEQKMAAVEQVRRRLAAAPPELSPQMEAHLDAMFADAREAVLDAARSAPDPDEETP